MIVVPVRDHHEFDSRGNINAQLGQVVESDRTPGHPIDAGVHDYPLASTEVKDYAFPDARTEDREFELVGHRRRMSVRSLGQEAFGTSQRRS